MYITVMDFSTSSVSKIAWDVESASSEEVEIVLEAIGYRLSDISYMTTIEEPEFALAVELSDILPDINIEKLIHR